MVMLMVMFDDVYVDDVYVDGYADDDVYVDDVDVLCLLCQSSVAPFPPHNLLITRRVVLSVSSYPSGQFSPTTYPAVWLSHI